MAQITVVTCPGCNKPLTVTEQRRLNVLARGGSVFHNMDCQRAAARETRPCSACGTPVTRYKKKFTEGPVACSPACRGALRKTAQTYECKTCGTPVERAPALVKGDVYCSRQCTSEGMRTLTMVAVKCQGCGKYFEAEESRARNTRHLRCSPECRKQSSRVELPCTGCGTTVWRYRSTLAKRGDGVPRVFCGPCRDNGAGLKPRNGNTEPCGTCGTPVYRRPSEMRDGPRFCSLPCKAEADRGRQRVERVERDCVVCGEKMILGPDRWDVQTCSRKCTDASKRRKERYVDKRSGYAIVTTPDGRVMPEHRWVMEQHIGRPLFPTETVHHLTGGFAGRCNNDLSNLELWSGRHQAGHRVEDIVRYCREMLAVYGDKREHSKYAAYAQAVIGDTTVFEPDSQAQPETSGVLFGTEGLSA